MKNDKVYLFNIPISRSNFKTTKSAKFKGNLKLISNNKGIIYDWKIEFSFIAIDIFTTKSWFQKQDSKFKLREKLFQILSIKQEVRPSIKENKILELDNVQIKKVNDFFNNRGLYTSTIKNIVGILKGNNPAGEAKNPNSAELVLDDEKSKIKNIVILIDDLCRKKIGDFDLYELIAEEKEFEYFFKLNDKINQIFEYMQKTKTKESFSVYLENIKKYYNMYNINFSKVEVMVKKEKKKHSRNINKMYKNKILPFNFKGVYNQPYQKAHIYEVWKLRDDIIDAFSINNEKKVKKYLKMISDPENFIPLEEAIHRKFDSYEFTYNENGIMKTFNDSFESIIKQNNWEKYKIIEPYFMTFKRKEYFKLRQKNILNQKLGLNQK